MPDPPLEPHGSHPLLRRGLAGLLGRARGCAGPRYRATSPRWAASDRLLDGEGARRAGGRWNPPGIPVAYLSESPEAALAEYLAGVRAAGFAVSAALPAVVAWGDVRLTRILDPTRKAAWSALGTEPGSLSSLDWRAENEAGREAASQSLARAARDLGLEGLRVPSAAVRGAANLVLFVDQLDPRSRVTPHGTAPPGV